MIAKEKTFAPRTRTERAGDRGERELAFFLERRFRDSSSVLIFHDLLIDHRDRTAQIDHLVVHPWGMFVIESKTLNGTFVVDTDGQWIMKRGRREEGARSPVAQVRFQRDLLRDLLQSNRTQLRGKVMFGFRQGGFKTCPMVELVAIGVKAVVKASSGADVSCVRKADLVPDLIADEIARHERATHLLAKPDEHYGMWRLAVDWELDGVRQFLIDHDAEARQRHEKPKRKPSPPPTTATPSRNESIRHTPDREAAPRSAPSAVRPEAPPTARSLQAPPEEDASIAEPRPDTTASHAAATEAQPACRHCGSAELAAGYGYSYFWKCRQCGKSTPMPQTCPACGEQSSRDQSTKVRVAKRGPEYQLRCDACGHRSVVWTEPGEPRSTHSGNHHPSRRKRP